MRPMPRPPPARVSPLLAVAAIALAAALLIPSLAQGAPPVAAAPAAVHAAR